MRLIILPVTAFVARAPSAASAQQPFPARPVTPQSTVVRAELLAGDVACQVLLQHG